MDVVAAESTLGVYFENKNLLLQALTHRSFLNENRTWPVSHNERLEFLGDSVLELVITDFLLHKYPEKEEGELTAVRASLVSTVSLYESSLSLGVNNFLLMSKGEAKDTGRARRYLLANTFEALIGALYLDQGYDVAREFIAIHLFPKTDKIVDKRLWQDPKSRFQEFAQERIKVTPRYELLEEAGPAHARSFVMGVYIGPRLAAKGTGGSKQEAEQKAAEVALLLKGWD